LLGNQFLTLLSNMTTNINPADMKSLTIASIFSCSPLKVAENGFPKIREYRAAWKKLDLLGAFGFYHDNVSFPPKTSNAPLNLTGGGRRL
jgi:hypothetical protein